MDAELRQIIKDATGLGPNNKALIKYYNSGIEGVMSDIYNVIDAHFVERLGHPIKLAMTLLLYNRSMNGSRIPGTRPGFNILGEHDLIHCFMDEPAVRDAALSEIRPATLEKWLAAIELVDMVKRARGMTYEV